MRINLNNKILSVSLRALGITGKFLLVLVLSKISLELQGSFTLINTNIALLIILMGFEFYNYSNKLIVKDKTKLSSYFKNALLFYGFMYVILLPIVVLLVYLEFLPLKLAVVFYFIAISEHLSQELFRINIALGKVGIANLILFIRTGLWAWLILIYWLISKNSIELINILSLWLFFSILSIVVALKYLPGVSLKFKKFKFDKKWIVCGIKIGGTIFVSTILLKIIEYSDRYLIDFFLGKKNLGIYAFFYQFSNIINVLIFTLYISYSYPFILKSVYEKNIHLLNKEKRKIYISSFTLVIILAFSVYFGMNYLLDFIDKIELKNSIYIVYILIISALFFNISYASHYVLIAAGMEKKILLTTMVACIIDVILNILLLPYFGIIGSAFALLLSSIALFFSKLYYELNLTKKWVR